MAKKWKDIQLLLLIGKNSVNRKLQCVAKRSFFMALEVNIYTPEYLYGT